MNNVLFEIGVEELPARFIDHAEQQLKEKTESWLHDHRIKFEKTETFTTPRRLAIVIHGIHDKQTAYEEEVRGPRLDIAKDESGAWTKAALGFTKGQNQTTDNIYEKEEKGIKYIYVKKVFDVEETKTLLQSYVDVIDKIQFPQTMRWGNFNYRFARPIRWLVALYNQEIIPLKIENIKSSNVSQGHRFLGEAVTITDPLQYEVLLENAKVIAHTEKRRSLILEQMKQLEKEENFNILIDESLLNEVVHLVEYPTVFFGTFTKEYLSLPSNVLITTMQEHQRYFPVVNDEQVLLPYFISVRN